jgi:hypothetical protein
MKTFVKENWYKLMVGSSMLMVSFGFMIYAISPAYSSNNDKKVDIPSSQNTSSPVVSNGVIVDENVYFVSGGFLYSIEKDQIKNFIYNYAGKLERQADNTYKYVVPKPIKRQLP